MSASGLDPAALAAGQAAYRLAEELFPICRSITGPGVRATLAILKRELPDLVIHELPTGRRILDWTVPNEWSIDEAYLEGPDGARIVDFRRHNLHVVNYSAPVDRTMTLEELEPHLYSLPEQPDAIPYVTSYYSERWGFCLADRVRKTLGPGRYRAVIRSELKPGALTYGEVVIPGASADEIFLSTYICHPSLANNELSGPTVAVQLARWFAAGNRRHTLRLAFVPETIGAIAFLAERIEHLRRNVRAGYVVTCVGDDRTYSFLPSRLGNTLADRVARHVLNARGVSWTEYSFLDRGSDERQYCSPGVDLPVASVMRSKYATYPEYHTSLDDLTLISPAGLAGGFAALRDCLDVIDANRQWRARIAGEPQMSRRGLYPTTGGLTVSGDPINLLNFLAYADGAHDLIAIAERIGLPARTCIELAERLLDADLIEPSDA